MRLYHSLKFDKPVPYGGERSLCILKLGHCATTSNGQVSQRSIDVSMVDAIAANDRNPWRRAS